MTKLNLKLTRSPLSQSRRRGVRPLLEGLEARVLLYTDLGDQWTYVAIDPESKLIPVHRVGKRDLPTATAFMTDLADRLANRVQLSSDALAAYVDATERAFGGEVDYGQAVKIYEGEPAGAGRYSPPHVVRSEKVATRRKCCPAVKVPLLSAYSFTL